MGRCKPRRELSFRRKKGVVEGTGLGHGGFCRGVGGGSRGASGPRRAVQQVRDRAELQPRCPAFQLEILSN